MWFTSNPTEEWTGSTDHDPVGMRFWAGALVAVVISASYQLFPTK